MDLLSGLRKGDNSRGGRADFKWEDVKEDKDRENYLGHSLMAPVGRWQRGKDLTWYARAGDKNKLSAEEERKAEIARIKEAEQDALSEALGFPVVRRHHDPVTDADVKKAIRDTAAADDDADDDEAKEEGRGIGYGSFMGGVKGLVRKEEGARVTTDAQPVIDEGYKAAGGSRVDGKGEERNEKRERRRSRSRSRDHRRRGDDRDRKRHRSRSRRRDRERHDRDHSRDRQRDGSPSRRHRHGDRGDRHGDRDDRYGGDRGDRRGDRDDRRGERNDQRGERNDRRGEREDRRGDRGDRREYRDDRRAGSRSRSPRRGGRR